MGGFPNPRPLTKNTCLPFAEPVRIFFKAALRQSRDMASEYSTNLEEVSAIFLYFTRFVLNFRRLRQ